MRSLFAAALGLAAFAAHAQAQALSLLEAEDAAMVDAPSVASSAALVAVAHADTGIAGMLPNPRLGVGGGVNYLVVADFFILLPVFGQLGAAEDEASARERATEAGVAVARLDARLAAALAWIDLWAAEQDARLGAEDADRRDDLFEIATTRFEAGDGTRLDVVRTRADALRARAEVRALEGAMQAAQARLGATLGRRDATSLHTRGPASPEAIDLPPLDAIDAIVASHPVARRFALSSRAAEVGVDRAHRARWPLLGLSVSDWVSRDTHVNDVRVLVTAEIPIFDQPRSDRAEAVGQAAHADAHAAQVLLRTGLVAARAELAAAIERCESERLEVLPAAREAAELAEEAYRTGALDLSAMLSAALLRSDAERRLARCLADRGRGWARLVHARGGPRG